MRLIRKVILSISLIVQLNSIAQITDYEGLKTENIDTTCASVKFKDKVVRENTTKLGYLRITKNKNQSYKAFIDSLTTLPNVEKIAPITKGEYLTSGISDPLSHNQWYINSLRFNDVWDMIPQRIPHTIVAILDTGFDFEHVDYGVDVSNNVFGRLHLNANEVPNNNVDDDHDGYIDNYYGWNFETNNKNISNDSKHGTSIYGMLGAISNNGLGTVSLLGNVPNIEIMPLVVGAGMPTSSMVADAIVYAVDHGANIINMSFHVEKTSEIEDAIVYAVNKGVLMVASAGNQASNRLAYPASNYDVMAIASVNQSNEHSSFSNTGLIDVAAYGENIFAPVKKYATPYSFNYDYDFCDGTSYSAPMVSALAALLRQSNPFMTASNIREAIDFTANKVGSDHYVRESIAAIGGRVDCTNTDHEVSSNFSLGFGLINPYAAISESLEKLPEIRICELSQNSSGYEKTITFELLNINNCFQPQDFDYFGGIQEAEYLVDWEVEAYPQYHIFTAEFDNDPDYWYCYISGNVSHFLIKGTIMDLYGNELFNLSHSIGFYSNPFSLRDRSIDALLTIDNHSNENTQSIGELRIYSLQNQLLSRNTVSLSDPNITIATTNIPNGHYIVVLSSGGEKLLSEHIIINH